MDWLVKDLRVSDRTLLAEHFLALHGERPALALQACPRRRRVCATTSPGSTSTRTRCFGVLDDDLRLLGAAHVARTGETVELGISVLAAHRRHGLGAALLERASLRARNWGKRTLYIHCLSENETMMRLARKQSMRVVVERGEADAWLELPARDAASFFGEAFANTVAVFDHALKRQRYLFSNIQSGERFGGS
jgi:GNAT superfamily N-acetyltransferase